jgi:hypothetical protein
MTWLEGLKKDSPKLRNAHLQECLSSAPVREDTALVFAIKKILCAESIRCCWRPIQQAAIPTRGGAVTWLTVSRPAGDTLYATREGVESQGVAAIETWYKVAGGAPILQDAQLHGNFGFLANTVSADQVLQGHIFTPRTWIYIPNSCYRRHDRSFTDSQKKR